MLAWLMGRSNADTGTTWFRRRRSALLWDQVPSTTLFDELDDRLAVVSSTYHPITWSMK